MDLTAATEFLYASADPLLVARAQAVLEAAPAPEAVMAQLAALQNADGGWPFELSAGRPSAVDESARMLLVLYDLDELGSALAERTQAWLVAQQSPRGWWREPTALSAYNPPLWSDPESDAALVYTTARAAAALSVLGENLIELDSAMNWLQGQVAPTGLLPGFRIVATAWAVPAFVAVSHRDTRSVKRMIAGLGNALSPEWDAPLLSTLLSTLALARFPRATRVITRALEQVSALQLSSGAWPNEDGAPDAEVTFQIVRAARWFGLRAAV